MVCIHTEKQNQKDIYPFVLLEISVLNESPLGHLRYCLKEMGPPRKTHHIKISTPGNPPRNIKNIKCIFSHTPHWKIKKNNKGVVI